MLKKYTKISQIKFRKQILCLNILHLQVEIKLNQDNRRTAKPTFLSL